MQTHDVMSLPAELKFVEGGGKPGYFEGLASVNGNIDSHGDMLMPGAFTESLAERKATGRRLPKMYFNHSAFIGGSRTPIGRWDEMTETGQGLEVKGHLIGMDHPDIKQVFDLMMDGEADGLSIAFLPRPGGAISAKKGEGPRRYLKSVDLFAVDVVCDPSNPLARVHSLKSALAGAVDMPAALEALSQAMSKVRSAIASGVNTKQADLLASLDAVQEAQIAAHLALTGDPLPAGLAEPQSLREHETCIRAMLKVSNSDARFIAENGYKAWLSRDEKHGPGVTETKAIRSSLAEALDGFSLPSF